MKELAVRFVKDSKGGIIWSDALLRLKQGTKYIHGGE